MSAFWATSQPARTHPYSDDDQARAVAAATASVAVVPSASPFSKSPSVCAMVFVTWAKQMTERFIAVAKA